MQTIKVDFSKIASEQIDLIVDYLKRGQVIAYPTDTVYGLGCDAGNAEAIKKINKIKEEKTNKPLLVLMSDFKMLQKYCFFNQAQEKYLRDVWSADAKAMADKPDPVTVILKRKPILPYELTGGQNSLAVRLPDNDFLIKIISEAGFPIVSTSLNKKGERPLTNVENLEKYFKYLPDLVIDAGECKRTKPSKLIDIRDIGNIKVIRK